MTVRTARSGDKERLGTSDAAIILARRRMPAATEPAAKGEDIPGINSEQHAVRSTSLLLPKSVLHSAPRSPTPSYRH